jgi:predicted DNA-binding transcriptional regulator AlpA
VYNPGLTRVVHEVLLKDPVSSQTTSRIRLICWPMVIRKSVDDLLASLEEVPAEKIPAVLSQLAAAQSTLAARLLENGNLKHSAPESEQLLTAEEAAPRCGFSTDWLYAQARADKLPFAIRFGRSWRFSTLGLEEWLKLRSRNGR